MPNLCRCISGTVGGDIADERRFRIVAIRAPSITLPVPPRAGVRAASAMNARREPDRDDRRDERGADVDCAST